jgi:hypothetical protein
MLCFSSVARQPIKLIAGIYCTHETEASSLFICLLPLYAHAQKPFPVYDAAGRGGV